MSTPPKITPNATSMKTTRKPEELKRAVYSFEYDDFPEDGMKTASIVEWENGEGCTVIIGGDEMELTHQEMNVLEILFGHSRLIK